MKELRGVRPGWKYKPEKVTEIIHNCPICGNTGQVIRNEDYGVVALECYHCAAIWRSLTSDCLVCGDPNEYIVPGMCKSCYKKKKEGVS